MKSNLQKVNHNNVFLEPISSGVFKTVAELINNLRLKNQREAFIIGNSPTINNLTNRQWHRIKHGVSIGFNSFATFHKFRTDILMFEINDFYKSELGKRTFEAFKRYDDINKTVIVKDTDFTNNDTCNKFVNLANSFKSSRIVLADAYHMNKHSDDSIRNAYKAVFDTIKLDQTRATFLIRKRASIAMALFMFLIAGFKRIHFVACELENGDYFYGEKSNNIHLTSDPKMGYPVEKVIEQISLASDVRLKSYGGKLARLNICDNFIL